MSAPKATEAAVAAVQQALGCDPYWNTHVRPARAECIDTSHAKGEWTERGCPVAVAAADAAAPHNAAQAIRDAADEVQRVYDYHCPVDPTRYVGNAAVAHQWWSIVLGGTLRDLRERADRIEASRNVAGS